MPDTYATRKAHHRGREEDVRLLVEEARKQYLLGELTTSAYTLGMAFHFIADGTCPGTSTKPGLHRYQREQGYLRRLHNRWESEVHSLPVPRVHLLRMGTPNEVLLMPVEYEARDPSSSLRKSLERCLAVLELVWRPPSGTNAEEEALIEKAKADMPSMRSRVLYRLPFLIWILPVVLSISVSGWFLASYPLIFWFHAWFDERHSEPVMAKYRWCRFILKWYGQRH